MSEADVNARGAGRRIIVAVDDAVLAAMPKTHLRTRTGAAVDFVAHGSGVVADILIAPYTPTAPGRTLVAQTLSGAIYEIDESGRIWRNAELVHPEPLYDYGTPATSEVGILRIGYRAALLFVPHDAASHLRVRLTTPIVVVGSQPRLRGRAPAARRWLHLATGPLQER